jgi:redox-sensitive bicupin YhaK (pirin superfamily)
MTERKTSIAAAMSILVAMAANGGEEMSSVETSGVNETVRWAHERGTTRIDWLDSRHTFSFGEYRDPQHMGYGALRVINDDRVDPGRGFGTHPHQDMEIISYVVSGALAHKDSMGNGTTIRPGDVQRMSAGTGVTHSEFNPSSTDPVHFLQIWIVPEKRGLDPSYEQINFPVSERSGKLRLVGSRDGRDGSVTIHEDVDLYASLLSAGESAVLKTQATRQIWIQVVSGRVRVGSTELAEGDGLAVSGVEELNFEGVEDVEFLVFDLA